MPLLRLCWELPGGLHLNFAENIFFASSSTSDFRLSGTTAGYTGLPVADANEASNISATQVVPHLEVSPEMPV